MSVYPYSIDNGHGEILTFLARKKEGDVEYLEVENDVSPTAGPPMHVHFFQDETITIIEGEMGIEEKGKPVYYAKAGDTAHFPKGVYHRFWNSGTTRLKCRGRITPPDNVEYFLSGIFASVKQGKRGRPDPFDAAWLLKHYHTEFDMILPKVVKKVIFPMVLFIGRINGKERKFKDAPAARKG